MNHNIKTQVGIIGAGPSGLLLSQILHLQGIKSVIVECKSQEHVLSRIRAGVLEWGSVEILRAAGVGERMGKEGIPHDGFYIKTPTGKYHIDLKGLTGHSVMVYGQTEITKDLVAAREAENGILFYCAQNVTPLDLEQKMPKIIFQKDHQNFEIECDYIIGCDGYHGISRRSIPKSEYESYEKIYPFGWLGVLSKTPPVSEELVYGSCERGFSLCSMRSFELSRYYIQCDIDDSTNNWSDNSFWEELKIRIGSKLADNLVTGSSIEKSIAPLRSFVSSTMRYKKLFLAGDSAHIVPPTGAKGLNLAISDVALLSKALTTYYRCEDENSLLSYSNRALNRVWKAERFSWWMTNLLHNFPNRAIFDKKMLEAERDYFLRSVAGRTTIAENYVGLPLDTELKGILF